MKVVIAPDSFKGCLSASQVCEALACGVLAAGVRAQVVKVPLADGGEGTVDALVTATGGRLVTRQVEGPLGEPLEAAFGLLGDGDTAVIEMAAASGLPLVPPERRNPLLTTTYGTGQLIAAALDLGCTTLIVGIGGSATNDCGAGMAQALGARMYDASGREICRVTGGRLAEVTRVDVSQLDPRLKSIRLRVACDVDNPLYGPQGAAHVFAPQKGATPEMVAQLDAGLRHFAKVLEESLGVQVAHIPGAGAAGGLGAGLMAFCGARLERGAAIVTDAVRLREKLHGADLVITGEGRLDAQTAYGKAPAAVAAMSREAGVPVVAVGGSVDVSATSLRDCGLQAVFSILSEPISLEQAMDPARAGRLLAFTAEQILRALAAYQNSKVNHPCR